MHASCCEMMSEIAAINLQQYEIRLYPTLIRRVKRSSKKITSNDEDSNRLPIHHYPSIFLSYSLVMHSPQLRAASSC